MDKFQVFDVDGSVHEYEDSGRAMNKFADLAIKHGGFDKFKSDGGKLVAPNNGADTGLPETDTRSQASAPQPGYVTAHTTAPGTVSELARARVEAHDEYFRSKGLALPPPIYAPGMRVLSLGDENFKLSRQKHEELPLVEDSMQLIKDQVNRELRDDLVVQLRDVKMLDDGTLNIGSECFRLETIGLEQIINQLADVLPRARSLMLKLEPDLRAQVFNRQLAKANQSDELKIRTRVGGSTKTSIYSVVTKSYTPFDINVIANSVYKSLAGKGYRGEAYYNPKDTKLRVNAFYHADNIVDLAAGDVFKTGITVKASDNGTGGIHVAAVVIRNLCLNLIILGEGNKKLLSKRHRGELQDIAWRIDMAIAAGDSMFEPFAKEWKIARNTPASDYFAEYDEKAIATQLAAELDIGYKLEVIEALLEEAYNKERGTSLADWNNALTRLHESKLMDESRMEKVEALAYPILQKQLKALELT